eukprot:3151668-Rhodomonas_salina.2
MSADVSCRDGSRPFPPKKADLRAAYAQTHVTHQHTPGVSHINTRPAPHRGTRAACGRATCWGPKLLERRSTQLGTHRECVESLAKRRRL